MNFIEMSGLVALVANVIVVVVFLTGKANLPAFFGNSKKQNADNQNVSKSSLEKSYEELNSIIKKSLGVKYWAIAFVVIGCVFLAFSLCLTYPSASAISSNDRIFTVVSGFLLSNMNFLSAYKIYKGKFESFTYSTFLLLNLILVLAGLGMTVLFAADFIINLISNVIARPPEKEIVNNALAIISAGGVFSIFALFIGVATNYLALYKAVIAFLKQLESPEE